MTARRDDGATCKGLIRDRKKHEPWFRRCQNSPTIGPWCHRCANDRERMQSVLDALMPGWEEIVKGGKRAGTGRPRGYAAFEEREVIEREERERAEAARSRSSGVGTGVGMGVGTAFVPKAPALGAPADPFGVRAREEAAAAAAREERMARRKETRRAEKAEKKGAGHPSVAGSKPVPVPVVRSAAPAGEPEGPKPALQGGDYRTLLDSARATVEKARDSLKK